MELSDALGNDDAGAGTDMHCGSIFYTRNRPYDICCEFSVHCSKLQLGDNPGEKRLQDELDAARRALREAEEKLRAHENAPAAPAPGKDAAL